MTRIRFRLSTLLLLTALIAAGLATRNRSSAWYLSKSIPAGFEGSFKLAAFEEQDLLVCLKTTIPERLVVRRLSTGEVLQDFGSDLSGAEFLQAGQDGKLYGFGPYRVNRINMKTGESTQLMAGSDGPPESLLVRAVSPDGRSVLIAVQDVVVLPSGRGIIKPSSPVTYRVCDLADGKLRWELSTTAGRVLNGAFSRDAKQIGIQIGNRFQVWDYESNLQVYDLPLFFSGVDTPALFPDGKRLFAGNGIYDLQSGLVLGELKAAGLESAVVNDGLIIKCNHDQLNYWRRRRVEGSWSPLSFPEAWITGALALACLVNVVVYSHRQRNPD